MSPDLERQLATARARVDARLESLLAGDASRLGEAMRYAALGPGKRIRPILCLWTHEMLGGAQPEPALDASCALELVHAYSLVHDDLPCMDDDDLRRGRPTCHVVYGEALAVLAGDALLNLAFETLLGAPWDAPETCVEICGALARAAGQNGMLGGQALDLEAAGEPPTETRLESIHRAKTGALLSTSMSIGALAARAPQATQAAITQIGDHLGLAFQITDDILDVVGEPATLGKSAGKDADARKMTYPALYGIERSRALAAESVAAACAGLGEFTHSERLAALARYLVQRTR